MVKGVNGSVTLGVVRGCEGREGKGRSGREREYEWEGSYGGRVNEG